MTQGKDDKGIAAQFRTRQTRQIIAIAAALFLVLLPAVLVKRPDLFGPISRETMMAAQAVVIAAFLGFTAVNWRCPACSKRLGGDIHRDSCRCCGARFR